MTNEEAIEAINANYPPEKYSMLREALDMALALLKKQIPLKPLESEDDDVFAWSPNDIDYYCAICCQRIWKDQIYCPSCGQAVKWDD